MSSESWLIFCMRSWAILFSESGSPVCVLKAFPRAVIILLALDGGIRPEGAPAEPDGIFGVVITPLVCGEAT